MRAVTRCRSCCVGDGWLLRIHYCADDEAVLRSNLTVSGKSRMSWKRPSCFAEYLDVTVEVLDVLEKALAGGDGPDPLFPELAIPETDLSRVRGAFDITVADPDQLRGEPDTDDDTVVVPPLE